MPLKYHFLYGIFLCYYIFVLNLVKKLDPWYCSVSMVYYILVNEELSISSRNLFFFFFMCEIARGDPKWNLEPFFATALSFFPSLFSNQI